MKRYFLMSFATMALMVCATLFLPRIGATQTPPPIGGRVSECHRHPGR